MVTNGNKCERINLEHVIMVHKRKKKNSSQIGLAYIYHSFPIAYSTLY